MEPRTRAWEYMRIIACHRHKMPAYYGESPESRIYPVCSMRNNDVLIATHWGHLPVPKDILMSSTFEPFGAVGF